MPTSTEEPFSVDKVLSYLNELTVYSIYSIFQGDKENQSSTCLSMLESTFLIKCDQMTHNSETYSVDTEKWVAATMIDYQLIDAFILTRLVDLVKRSQPERLTSDEFDVSLQIIIVSDKWITSSVQTDHSRKHHRAVRWWTSGVWFCSGANRHEPVIQNDSKLIPWVRCENVRITWVQPDHCYLKTDFATQWSRNSHLISYTMRSVTGKPLSLLSTRREILTSPSMSKTQCIVPLIITNGFIALLFER